MNQPRFLIAAGLFSVLILAMPNHANAAVVVNFDPSESEIFIGQEITVSITANMSLPIVGWGFHFIIADTDVVSLVGDPTVNANLWHAVPGIGPGDGVGIGGLAFPDPVSGNNILLATVKLKAEAVGTTALNIGINDADLTQGFALVKPGAFDTYTINPGSITVVIPGPSAALLLCFVPLAAGSRRRH